MPAPAVTVLRGDARALPLDDATVDAIVCDPPYELGFMSKGWDSTGVAYDVATWREAYRVMRPGAFLLAFGGSRTWHRLAVAIEDAGFELRDSIAWHYSSGFPKSLDVSKAIDKAAGAEREVVGSKLGQPGYSLAPNTGGNLYAGKFGGTGDPDAECAITAPATDDARRWQGWGTALKPSFEPIVVARKPLAGTVAANVLTHGCGGINIDATRVATTESTKRANTAPRFNGSSYANGETYAPEPWISGSDSGRWPSNVVFSHPPMLDGDGRVVGDACADGCVEGCPVAELDAQSGTSTSPSRPVRQGGRKSVGGIMNAIGVERDGLGVGYGDSGGASRYFPTFRYQAKAPSKERPRVDGVAHPTVKPLALMQWLVRLVVPPGGLVLDPFAGSGTTVEAAIAEGFRVVGIEYEAAYLPLIQARIERATGQGR